MAAELTAPGETVYVVDDDASMRNALARLLRSADASVVAFESAEAFFAHPRKAAPGCLVLDLWIPGLDGLGMQQRLKAEGDGLPIVFITGHGDVASSVRAMKEGAFDFLEKPFDEERLLAAVRNALQRSRERWAAEGDRHALARRHASLTTREREVMALVAQGRLNKVIAADLGISEKTVKAHRGRVMAKMGVRSVADLVRATQRLGIA